MTKKAKHVGVYALLVQDECVLMIKKARGPYTCQWDLPGGGPEHGEEPLQTLLRECDEEIGVPVRVLGWLANLAVTPQWIDDGELTETHHIGMYYAVELLPGGQLRTEADGHDSAGAAWVPLAGMRQADVAPMVWQLLRQQSLVQ